MKRLALVAALLVAPAAHAEDAAALFQARCALCHGAGGKGSEVGKSMGVPDLTAVKISSADAAKVIRNGRSNMPSFQGVLSDAEIARLADHVAGGLRAKK